MPTPILLRKAAGNIKRDRKDVRAVASVNESEVPIEMTIPIGKIKKEKYSVYSESIENGTITLRNQLKNISLMTYNRLLSHPDSYLIEDFDGENFIQDTINSLIQKPIDFSVFPNLNFEPWEFHPKNSYDYIKQMTIPDLFKVVDRFDKIDEKSVDRYLSKTVADRENLIRYAGDVINNEKISVKYASGNNSPWTFKDMGLSIQKPLTKTTYAEILPIIDDKTSGKSPVSKLYVKQNADGKTIHEMPVIDKDTGIRIKDNETFTSKAQLITAADYQITQLKTPKSKKNK